MSYLMALPHEDNLNAVFQMFSFLKIKHNGVTVFDHAEPNVDKTQFLPEDWSATTCGSCKEEIPSNFLVPKGTSFSMRYFIGFGHAGDLVARH